MFDPTELPRIVEWRASSDGSGLGLVDYVGRCVGATAAVAVVGLLWPRLIRVDQCILIADRYDPQTFAAWRDRASGRAEIEAAINHVHLWDVFDDTDDVQEGALEFLGGVMCQTWRLAVAEAFPGEPMEVEFTNDPDDYGPTVTMRSGK